MQLHKEYDKEVALHDGWSGSERPEQVDVLRCMESVNAVENRFILECIITRFGGLGGLRVLDLGVGLGESAVYFAMKGAKVTAVDLSPGMVEFCGRLAERHGVRDRMEFITSPVEDLRFAEGSYDVIYSANILHHVEDKDSVVRACHGWLRPGGAVYTIDPVKYNPVINVYRSMARDVRSETEEPVGREYIGLFRDRFTNVRHREFWLLALSLFLKFYIIDRYDPNKVRYWKKVLDDSGVSGGGFMGLLHRIDGWALRVPGIRWLAWNVVVEAVK